MEVLIVIGAFFGIMSLVKQQMVKPQASPGKTPQDSRQNQKGDGLAVEGQSSGGQYNVTPFLTTEELGGSATNPVRPNQYSAPMSMDTQSPEDIAEDAWNSSFSYVSHAVDDAMVATKAAARLRGDELVAAGIAAAGSNDMAPDSHFDATTVAAEVNYENPKQVNGANSTSLYRSRVAARQNRGGDVD